MAHIISAQRYQSQIKQAEEKYKLLTKKEEEDKKWKKLRGRMKKLRSLYHKDKVYAVKQLNFFEQSQILFQNEKRALIVFIVELLQKLILHKKLNKPVVIPKFKKQ